MIWQCRREVRGFNLIQYFYLNWWFMWLLNFNKNNIHINWLKVLNGQNFDELKCREMLEKDKKNFTYYLYRIYINVYFYKIFFLQFYT